MADTPPRPPPPPSTGRSPRDVVRVNLERGYFDDVYHYLMEAPWSRLLLLIGSAYLGVNVIFALLYLLGGDCIQGAESGSFGDRFFFSVQTLSTVGYGVMSPKGTYGSVLVTFEAFVGLLGMAMASGLMFSKFARPTARVIFSKQMVVNRRNGKPCLLLRMANGRGNDVVEASLRVAILKSEVTAEGERMRRFHDLHLQRSQTPLFSVTWVVIHEIDERSPLHGETQASLTADRARLIVTFTGIDGTFSQTVHARMFYEAEDIVWDARFVDVIEPLPTGQIRVDYARFHDVEPLPAAEEKAKADAA
jgi:inward rectifier potassium channel